MNENGSFFDWLKFRWKIISVSDSRFFRFIWIVSIVIIFISVLISAGFTSRARKKSEEEANKKAMQELAEQAEQEAAEATPMDATPMDAVADENAWKLMLVNSENPMPEGYEIPAWTELRNNQWVDSRIYPELQQMFDDARAEGYSPYITSSYRSKEDQQAEFDNKVNELLEQGKTQEQAQAETAAIVAQPGYSEHETGLAIDVGSDVSEEAQNQLWNWLADNSYKYGFIIRYPENKVTYTGISNEPWHLRYVGVEAATEMYNNNQCLEEYLLFR